MDWPSVTSHKKNDNQDGLTKSIELSKFGRGTRLGCGTLLTILGGKESLFGNIGEEGDPEDPPGGMDQFGISMRFRIFQLDKDNILIVKQKNFSTYELYIYRKRQKKLLRKIEFCFSMMLMKL